eukprot:3500329-Rhodomonas_salina.1
MQPASSPGTDADRVEEDLEGSLLLEARCPLPKSAAESPQPMNPDTLNHKPQTLNATLQAATIKFPMPAPLAHVGTEDGGESCGEKGGGRWSDRGGGPSSISPRSLKTFTLNINSRPTNPPLKPMNP